MIRTIFSAIAREVRSAESRPGAADTAPQLKANWNGDSVELVPAGKGWKIEKNDAVVSDTYRFASPPLKISIRDEDGDGDPDMTVTLKDGKRQFIEGTDARYPDDPIYGIDADEDYRLRSHRNSGADEVAYSYDPAPAFQIEDEEDPLGGLDMNDDADLAARLAASEKSDESETWKKFASRPDIAGIINQFGTTDGCGSEQIMLRAEGICAEFSRADMEEAVEKTAEGEDYLLAPTKRYLAFSSGDTVDGERGDSQDDAGGDELGEVLRVAVEKPATSPQKKPGKVILPPPPPKRAEDEGPRLARPQPDKEYSPCDEFLPDDKKWEECMESPRKAANKLVQEIVDYFSKELTCPTKLEEIDRLKDIVAEYDKHPSDIDPTPLMGFTPIERRVGNQLYLGEQYHLPLSCGYNFSLKKWSSNTGTWFLDKERFVDRKIVTPDMCGPRYEAYYRYLGLNGRREQKTIFEKFETNLYKQVYDSIGMPGVYDEERIKKIEKVRPKGNALLLTGAARFIPLTKDLYIKTFRGNTGWIFYYGLISIPRPERFLATACKQEIWHKNNPGLIEGDVETAAFDLGIALLLEKAQGLRRLTEISKTLGDSGNPLPAPSKARLMEEAKVLNRTIGLSADGIKPDSEYARALIEKHKGESACQALKPVPRRSAIVRR